MYKFLEFPYFHGQEENGVNKLQMMMFISALFCQEIDGTDILLPKHLNPETHIFAVETLAYLGHVTLAQNFV